MRTRQPWRIPLIAALALAFGSLALISGIAYVAVLAGATGTTERFVVDRVSRVIEAQESLIKNRLDPVAQELEMIAALAAQGRIDIDSPVAIRETLAVMLTQMPEVSITAFASLDLQLDRAVREPNGSIARDTVPLAEVPGTLERFRELQTVRKAFWGDLFWSPTFKQPLLNVRAPVRRNDGAFIGALVATVGIGNLSQVIEEASPPNTNYFILIGHHHVLAHRRLVDPKGLGLSPAKPLPTIAEIGDPVLAHIWDPQVHSPAIERALGNLGHIDRKSVV